MSAKTFNVCAKLFHAVAHFSARGDVRYYLNGVCIAPCEQGGVVIVATNGYSLGAMRDPEGETSGEVIVPYCAAMAKIFEKSKEPAGKVRLRASNVELTNHLGQVLFIDPTSPALIDGKFPDWRKTVPDAESMTQPQKPTWLDYNYMKPFFEAARVLDGHRIGVHLHTRGEESAVVTLGLNGAHEFFGIVMPLRAHSVSEKPGVFPGWTQVQKPVPIPEPEGISPDHIGAMAA